MPQQLNNIFIGKPGKLPVLTDPRSLSVSNYINLTKLKNVPTQLDWTVKKTTPWGMMDNWTLSDCTCAAAGHMIECWTANSTKEHIIHDKAVLAAFIALTGYDPATGKNDNPVYLSAALKYWRKNGVGNHKIKAYATINYKSHDMVRAAVYLFGGVYVGVNLPNTIKGQAIWEVMPGGLTGDNAPGSFGGHAITVLAYDDQYITAISWGKVQKMTWEFWDTYCDELYAIITEDFFNENKTPLGLDLSKLESDLLGATKAKKDFKKQLTKNQNKMSEDKKSKTAGKGGQSAGAAGRSAGSSGSKAGSSGRSAGRSGSAAGAGGANAGAKASELAPKKKIAAGGGRTGAGKGGANSGAKGSELAPRKKAPAGGGHASAGAGGQKAGAKASELAPKKKVAAGQGRTAAGVGGANSGAKGSELAPKKKVAAGRGKTAAGKGGGKGGVKASELAPKKKVAAGNGGQNAGAKASELAPKKKDPAGKGGTVSGAKASELAPIKKRPAGNGGQKS